MIEKFHSQTQLSIDNITYKNQTKVKQISNPGIEKTMVQVKEKLQIKGELGVVYEPGTEEGEEPVAGYTVDMEKIRAMKEETEARLWELFKDTARGTGLKQLGGVRGILDRLRAGEKVTLEIEYTPEDVEQAKVDVAEGGYWSAEETSNRLIDFAKALSGGDPEKASLLKDAFVKAFEEIEEMFGGELPQLSYDTYDLTIEKFNDWAGIEEEVQEPVVTDPGSAE